MKTVDTHISSDKAKKRQFRNKKRSHSDTKYIPSQYDCAANA